MQLQFAFIGSLATSSYLAPTHLRARRYVAPEPIVKLGPLQPR